MNQAKNKRRQPIPPNTPGDRKLIRSINHRRPPTWNGAVIECVCECVSFGYVCDTSPPLVYFGAKPVETSLLTCVFLRQPVIHFLWQLGLSLPLLFPALIVVPPVPIGPTECRSLVCEGFASSFMDEPDWRMVGAEEPSSGF